MLLWGYKVVIMMKRITRLEDVISNPMQAIFYALQSFDVPWKSLNVNINLDSDYNICHSGKKITSPLVDFFIDSETGKVDSTSMVLLANIIYTKYGVKWNKQWDTQYFEYDPISNYDMEEKMTDDETVHEFGHGMSGSYTVNGTIENKKAGFNSSDYQKDTQNISQNTGSQSNTENGTNTDTRNYTLTRKGNIGVTTSQQMIESERNLWMWNYFEEIVYPDIDRVLTINMY